MKPLLARITAACRAAPVCAALLLLAPVASSAANAEAPQAAVRSRPRIGLVLSGGGARGIAHIGVLKVLEELRVPVDCITGTSMGGIVGGVYASGMGPEEMAQKVQAIDWTAAFQDRPDRRVMNQRRKDEESGYLARPEFGFRDGSIQVPAGVVYGQNLEQLFADLGSRADGITDFSRLPIPFKTVGTDIETGRMVVMDRGPLFRALRATMSVPGAMAPADYEGKAIVDGGLVQNLPVDLVRKMCADVVIAVNLGTPLLKRSEITSVLGVTEQMINILTEQNVNASLASLKPTDILISPELGDISAGSFDRSAESIALGEAAARKVESSLRPLSLPPDQYAALRKARDVPTTRTHAVDRIEIAPLKHVNPEVVTSELTVRPGELSRDEIQQDIRTIYERGDFERVSTSLLRAEDGTTVGLIEPLEKSWGPNYLRFGLSLTSSFRNDTDFTAVASYTRTWVNSLGAEWKNQGQIGQIGGILSEFYQPLSVSGGPFVAPRVVYERSTTSVYFGDDKIAQYLKSTSRVGLDLGYEKRKLGEARVGLIAGRLSAETDIGLPLFDNQNVRQGAWTARLTYDQLDSVTFPQSGNAGRLDVFLSRSALGADDEYNRAVFNWTSAGTWDNNTFSASVRLGGGWGEDNAIPAYDSFTLGGFQQLSGYDVNRFRGQGSALGRLDYYRVIAPPLGLRLGGILDNMYAGGSLEAGKVFKSFDPLTPSDWYYSASLFVGADTVIGPIYLAYGQGESGNRAFWVYIGRPWFPQ